MVFVVPVLEEEVHANLRQVLRRHILQDLEVLLDEFNLLPSHGAFFVQQIAIVAVPLTHDTLDLLLVLELKAGRRSGVHEDLRDGRRGGQEKKEEEAEHVVLVVAFKVSADTEHNRIKHQGGAHTPWKPR